MPRSARDVEQVLRVVEPVDVESRFGEQVRVAPLAARHVENARAGRQPEQLDQPRDFLPVALEREERLVLEQILRVEVRISHHSRCFARALSRASRAQKKTGSRYAPNTSSSAARISYSVQ